MKTIQSVLLTALLTLTVAITSSAQLVADGATTIIDATTTNLGVGLIVGTNGSFTTLIITNTGTVTNTTGVIGSQTTAKTNQVIVTGANSVWKNTSTLAVGSSGDHNLLLVSNGGTVLDTSGNLSLNAGSSNNTVVVNDTNSLWSSSSSINVGNIGPFNLLVITNGGRATAGGTARLGNSSASSNNLAIITGAGSTISAVGIEIGPGGSLNQLLISNGANVTSTGGYVGANSTRTGSGQNNSVMVTGAGSLWTNTGEFVLGDSGSFNQLTVINSGTVVSTNGLLGYNPTSSGNLAMVGGAGSLWTNRAALSVGRRGSFNTLTVSDSGTVVDADGYLGEDPASVGNMVIVVGTNSLWKNTQGLQVGQDGSFNTLLITNGGTVTNTGSSIIGSASTANSNQVIVTGISSAWQMGNNFSIGIGGSFNLLLVTNGGAVQSLLGSIGGNSASSNNVAVVTGANSFWKMGGNLGLGINGPNNQLTVNDAGIVTANSIIMGFSASSVNNGVTLSGGSIIVTNGTFTSQIDVRRGTITLNAGLLRTDSLLQTNGAQSQLVFNGGTLQTRNTTNNIGSPFTVGDGVSSAIFELLGNGTHSFANGLTVRSNASLIGNGTIIGNVTNSDGGMLSPGASIGKLTLNGNLVLAAGSTNVFELNKSSVTNDNIIGLASVSYGGALVVTNLSGTLGNGDAFKLFSAAGYAGGFSTIAPASPGAGLKWNTNGLIVDGTLRVAAVPPPPPVITNVTLLNGTNLVFNASGGVPYDPVYLLTATNVALQIANWDYVATNYFDPNGNASITNAIVPAEPGRYFRLQAQ